MDKSLYFEIVKRYFPQLVTSVVEQLNEKRRTQLPYLYKERLTPTFSADGRWASVLAQYTRVAADVVALDSELPLKSRDALSTAQGDIPKMGMKLYLNERQMRDIDSMLAQNMQLAEVANKIFSDVPRTIEGVWERIEDLLLSGLSRGISMSGNSTGTGVRINYGFYPENQFNFTTAWNDHANATPLTDIQNVFDKALNDQNSIIEIWLDDTALNNLYKSKEVREQFAFDNSIVVVSGGTVPTLDFGKLGQVFMNKWGVKLVRIARSVKTEINGKKVNHKPWKKGVMTFVCNEKLGTLVYTNCAEATRPAAGVEYQTADGYILVSKYSKNDPLREFTSSQAMVLPVIDNVDQIYTLETWAEEVATPTPSGGGEEGAGENNGGDGTIPQG